MKTILSSAKTKMPARDYVSIIRSLYEDRFALPVGSVATAAGAAIAGLSSQAPIQFVFAALFILLGLWRYQETQKFDEQNLASEDAEGAELWELRATISGVSAALLFGAWCFVSLVYVKDEYSILVSLTVTIAAMVGIVARNYGLDRLVTLQSFFLGTPLCLGLVLDGNLYHVLLAALFVPMFVSFRSLARDVRIVLLSAARDRTEVFRLAGELDTALSTMSHGLCMLDNNLNVAVANEKMQEMLCGTTGYDCVGRSFSEMVEIAKSRGALTELSGQRLATAVAIGGQNKLVLQLLDGRHCEVSINRGNQQTVLVLEDITERVQSESRIKFMARFDPATNLPNRAFFSEQVAKRLNALRGSGRNHGVGFFSLDIDDFKHINDTYGHPMGDRVLTMISARLRQALDSDVLVGRFGGDEFCVFFDTNVSIEGMKLAASSLLLTLNQPFVLDDQLFEICVSIGVVVSSSDETDLEGLLQRADLALYSAKGSGKNQWALYNAGMSAAYRDRKALKEALREALDKGDLRLAYQPVVDIETHKIRGCEALARWHHPELGVIPPYVFVPLAEEMGIVSELTEWALHTATRECATWPEDIGVAVNISAWDFKGDNVQRMVYSALQQSGLSPERLEIEVTESVLVQELEVASKALSEISCQGVGIALDDFGTGYSSLAYLHNLPFSKLKIDRTFMADITNDPRARKLMRNIAVLGRDLSMKITVEGVETEEQLQVVSDVGMIDYIQGYLFGAPVSQNEIRNLMRSFSGSSSQEVVDWPELHSVNDQGQVVKRGS